MPQVLIKMLLGYKKHHVTDDDGLVLGFQLTSKLVIDYQLVIFFTFFSFFCSFLPTLAKIFNGIFSVGGLHTTTASKNEISNLEEVLDTVNIKLPEEIPLKGNKGNQSKKNAEILKRKNSSK